MSIPFDQLVKGTVYKLHSRNLATGVFTGKQGFIGIRTKFGSRYLFEEIEYSQDNNYGTAVATEMLGTIPLDIPLTDRLGTACATCSKPVNFDKSRSYGARWEHDDDAVPPEDAHDIYPVSVSNQQLFEALEAYETPRKR